MSPITTSNTDPTRGAMLEMFAFLQTPFDTPAAAQALLDYLASGPFAPVRFGTSEPMRKRLDARSASAAVALLTGPEQALAGDIFLGAPATRATLAFRWARGELAEWFGELDPAALPEAARWETLSEFWTQLFRRFPVAFAGVATRDQMRRKHWRIIEEDDGGETAIRTGPRLDSDGRNPGGPRISGIYWLTVFGPALVAELGRDRLCRLAAEADAQPVDLGPAGGLILRLGATPDAPGPAACARLEQRLGLAPEVVV